MNLDDETYLSAYPDDELDPAERPAVEWAVESSPPLADQLRSIALARDAVAGLDRPSIPRDLGPALGARIAADRRRARLGALARPAGVALAFSTFSAMAASLIFALILLHQAAPTIPRTRPDVVQNIGNDPAHRTHPIQPSDPAPKPTEIVSTEPVYAGPSPESRPRRRDVLSLGRDPALPDGAREQGYRRLISRMLERPRVRRIVIVTDIQDAPDLVQELIRDDARQTPEFGRISICQDIVVDADRAEPAEVFAVPMDGRVRRSFVDRLRRQFPGLVEEGESKPELVTQLSEVGRVAVFRGTEAAPLGEPPLDVQPVHRQPDDRSSARDHIARARSRTPGRPPPGGRLAVADFVGPPASIEAPRARRADGPIRHGEGERGFRRPAGPRSDRRPAGRQS